MEAKRGNNSAASLAIGPRISVALGSPSLVIITPAEFSSRLQPLVPHKINRGITTKIVTLEEIYGGVYFQANGRDNAEKIKNFIKNAIEQWVTTNVLLVGSSSKFPTRDTHFFLGSAGHLLDRDG